MADARLNPPLRHWFVALVMACTLFTLVTHFVADAACRSPELPSSHQCRSAGNRNATADVQLATGSLHTGVVVPAVLAIASPVALSFAIVGASFFTLAQFVSPPVQPPKALSIA